MKKLYLISYYFAPLGRADGVNRTYMTKYLAELGWSMDVISCANPHGFLQSFAKDYSLMDIIPPQVKLHRVKSIYWGPLGGIASLMGLAKDPFGNWFRPAVKAAEAIVNNYGIIYAIVPPVTNARVASIIATRKQMPLVIDFRDNVFNLPKDIVRSCRTIIASTEHSLEDMKKYYNLPQEIGFTMYNGYPGDVFPVSRNGVRSGSLKIVYAGLINLDQDPAMLAHAVKLMEERDPDSRGKVSVEYYGPRNYYTRLFLKKHLSDNIKLMSYIPFNMVLKKIAASDVAYSSLQLKNNRYRIPSKVFQYISMETPILGTGPDGVLKQLIEENDIGKFSSADNIEEQSEDIYFLLTNPKARENMIENIRRIKPQFAMKSQVEKLSEYLESFLVK